MHSGKKKEAVPTSFGHKQNWCFLYEPGNLCRECIGAATVLSTGFSSEIGTKLRDWAVGKAGGSCYSQAALSSNDSKTR